MSPSHERLITLRAELARLGLDGFILATGDEHITEFPAPYSERLAWLTGFAGSTASIAVLADKAAIFVDYRYTESVRTQVDGADWSYEDVLRTGAGAWLAEHAAGARIGYDPKLYTRGALGAIEQKLAGRAELVPLPSNPIDRLWIDQPARPDSQAFVQTIGMAGKSSADKRRDVVQWLTSIGADACVIVALDSIAWLFNIRASDVDVVPLCYSFAICHRDGSADLFVDPHKIDESVRQHLGESVRLLPYDRFYETLETLPGKVVSLDPNLTPVAIYAGLEKGGATLRADRDPTVLPKAIKNPVEIEGMKAAHIRDGAALTRFLHWFSIEAPKGQLTELSAAARLNQFRRETERFHSLSFEPISCVDGNASMPHYRATPESDAPIGPNSIYLVDSGGQYPDGTTDVARTVAVGETSAEFKDRFTRVLKGYIALQTTTFPLGTLGSRLDAIARAPLWVGGFECAHGIGHGVGHFLNVHEGPGYFLAYARPDEAPIEAGMILSNEPGYYRAGIYGIRTENLMVTVERPIAGGDRTMLGFEAITMAPIARNLIEVTMLTDAEVDWLDSYHGRVRDLLSPLLTPDERSWLERQTAPIRAGEFSGTTTLASTVQ
ncbi:peptidase M24 [Burkholderia lata]|uniref:Peptidase M24 n=1 Tax=Burkholderia lata (strain ATCC 17760 / DSM 23089 / LMG 22485 / NCIMB 9086 / R18194 / 383) TaxID=482957 RepID=A0A6P2SMH1_BURL3|nr:aminopeptidase P family protein [Burkholderia lata]VWC51137.1 peptidase M24 [Burkholderia lata]